MKKELPNPAELKHGNSYTFRFSLNTSYKLVFIGYDLNGRLMFYNETLNIYSKPMNEKRFSYLLRFKLEKFEESKGIITTRKKSLNERNYTSEELDAILRELDFDAVLMGL